MANAINIFHLGFLVSFRRIPGVWILGGGAPLVSVTVWGQSTPSVTREPGSVRVDREWRDRNVTSVLQAITDSPSVDVNVSNQRLHITF